MKLTRQVSLVAALLACMVAGTVHAAVITQNFDTGTILPGGGGTSSDFIVDQFDASLGTLIRVTFAMSLQTWGGYYTVKNATAPSAPVTGTMGVGIEAYLWGDPVPDPLPNPRNPLFAGQSTSYELAANGNTAQLNGPSESNPISAARSGDADAEDFHHYAGTGTFTVSFVSEEGSWHTASGAVDGSFAAASALGTLTVTYEYIPEPTTLALLAAGVVVLAVRRRHKPRV